MKNKYCFVIIFSLLLIMLAIIPVTNVSANWTYTVRQGDSLWAIANRYGTTVNGIKQASNHWSNLIMPGQRLVIPTGSSYSANSSQITPAERDLLARLVEAEAQGEPHSGQVGVAAVVLNRVRDSRFPNTINGVIYQRHAFEVVSNGLIWRRSPSQGAQRAVQQALNGWDPTYGSVFFWNPYLPVNSWIWSRPIVTQIGNHVFAH